MADLVAVVQKLNLDIRSTLLKAKNSLWKCRAQFFSKDYSILGKSIGHYADCFKALGIKSNSDFEKLIARNYLDGKVQGAAEELHEIQDDWTEFLDQCDKFLNERDNTQSKKAIKIDGDSIKTDQTLIDARNGKVQTIGSVLHEVNARHVLLILLRHFA